MKTWPLMVAISLAVGLATGCEEAKKKDEPSAVRSEPGYFPGQASLDTLPVAVSPGEVPPEKPSIVMPTSSTPKTTPAPAAPPKAAAPATKAAHHYTVKKGDTLASIAKHFYGDATQTAGITAANPGKAITTGTVLVIPAK
jgi:nucleoid-associated protein YgaU